jgi:hypothetical protein
MSEIDIDTETLAEQVIAELDPGTRIGDKFVLSKRQLLAAAGGTLGVGALVRMGIDEAEAQSAAGQVGTDANPLAVKAATISFPNLSNDYEIRKDGTDGEGIINFKTQ